MPFSRLEQSCAGRLAHPHEDLHTDPVTPYHLILLILPFLLLILLGHRPDSQAEPMPGAAQCTTVTDADDGGRILIKLRDMLAVRLKAIPGTGYAWHLVRNDPKFLKPLGEPVYEQSESRLLGGVEFQIFRFCALARGTNVLELHYDRAWEKKAIPLKMYHVIVEIL
jgi:predicted secreted protein